MQLSAVASNDDLNHELTSPLPHIELQLIENLQKSETPKSSKNDDKNPKKKEAEKQKFTFDRKAVENSRNLHPQSKELTPLTIAIEESLTSGQMNLIKQIQVTDDIKGSNHTL